MKKNTHYARRFFAIFKFSEKSFKDKRKKKPEKWLVFQALIHAINAPLNLFPVHANTKTPRQRNVILTI